MSTDLHDLRAACDQLVATAADPALARALLVRVWALGAGAAADLLDALGRPDDAARLRTAVAEGLAAHEHREADAARAERARRAARAAVRIAETARHRRAAVRAASAA